MPPLITMRIMWITMWMPSLNDENRYVCMSALLHLAMRGQTGLVKLALPIVPMLSDYFLTTSPLSMTEEERSNVAGMRSSWKALAQVKPHHPKF